MSYSFAQIILAARNDDVEGWMNILFVIILAVFWAIGGIIKARTKKIEEGKETATGKPPRRQPQVVKGLTRQLFQQPRPAHAVGPAPGRKHPRQAEQPARKITHAQAIAERITAKKEPVPVPTVKAPAEPKLPKLTPQLKPAGEGFPEVISKPVETLQAGLAAESLLDYADPDELRRAILHYEILGKPLSLRGPGEHIIGL